MRIVIIGGGQVGNTLASKLSSESHDVVLVERDAARAAELRDALDVQVVEGHGATADTLRRAGAAEASLLLATTDSDEVNFIAGRVAVSLFNVPQVVVRLRDPAHEEAFAALSEQDSVAIRYVNPEAAAVDRIVSMLEVPGALDIASFLGGELIVVGFPIGPESEFADRPVLDMRLFFAETPSLVAAIQRGDRAMVPGGGEVIRPGDVVYFALARGDLEGLLGLMDAERDPRRRVMIAGVSRIGLALARRLASKGMPVTLIETDRTRARAAAETLAEALVVHGSPTSHELLEEERIAHVNTFVAVTDDHEVNLVAGLLAKRLGAPRAFALVDNPALANLIGETSIDAIISPRLLAIGLTLEHVPGARVHSRAALLSDRVEVFEAEALRGSPLCKARLSDLALPKGVLVVAVRRGETLVVPRGDHAIVPGDLVLLVAETDKIGRVGDLLAENG